MRFQSTLVLALLASSAIAADDLKSGPQPGEQTGGFRTLFVNGTLAGQSRCPV